MRRRFRQVDVFTATPFRGNPLAVVIDAEGLDTEDMQAIASWTDLSETSFLVAPADPAADYGVRIFTPAEELPFAGHPTLGSAHAWLTAGNTPRTDGQVIQECGVGLVTIRIHDGRLAFAAPPLLRCGPVAADDLAEALDILRIGTDDVVDSAWIDNGPGWMGILLRTADEVLTVSPGPTGDREVKLGVVGPHAPGSASAVEIRGFFSVGGSLREDPVTGSLNASVAQWLLGTRAVSAPYRASQGAALGRAGMIHVDVADGQVWIGGDVVTVVDGTIVT